MKFGISIIYFSSFLSFSFISDHPILQTLETRSGDKMAQDFVKKQKLRISNS